MEPMGELSRRVVVLGAAGGLSLVALNSAFGPASDAQAATIENGQVPANMLTTVPGSSGSVLLEKVTAERWLALVAACRTATGVTMVVTSPDGGYRDLAQQQYLFEHPEGPVAIAKPGSSSHGYGTTVDILNRQYGWLTAHAGEYGFVQSFQSEEWHWQYTGAPGWATSPITPVDNSTEKGMEDMYIRRQNTGEIAVFGADFRAVTGGTSGRHIFATPAEYSAWRGIVATYNANIDATGGDARGKRYVPPANPLQVMNVDELGWGITCAMFGV